MVGRRVIGPSPLRDASKRAIRQSVPARKCVPGGDQRREEGVRYASVVGDMRLYVERGVIDGERQFVSRMGRSVGVER
jgi:hypothetical protein